MSVNTGATARLNRAETPEAVTIANGATESGAIDMRESITAGVQLPAAFTGTALTFLVSATETGTYSPLVDGAGSNISRTIAAGDALLLPNEAAPWPWIKIKAGSSQAAERALTIVRKR